MGNLPKHCANKGLFIQVLLFSLLFGGIPFGSWRHPEAPNGWFPWNPQRFQMVRNGLGVSRSSPKWHFFQPRFVSFNSPVSIRRESLDSNKEFYVFFQILILTQVDSYESVELLMTSSPLYTFNSLGAGSWRMHLETMDESCWWRTPWPLCWWRWNRWGNGHFKPENQRSYPKVPSDAWGEPIIHTCCICGSICPSTCPCKCKCT